ncbi:MAG: GTPase Era [Thermotogae bacterium]|nr:GTPase Era [Thermotogota bacterium]
MRLKKVPTLKDRTDLILTDRPILWLPGSVGVRIQTVKVGFVAIVGRPNVGKSTLVNALLKFKLAAVSPKPQTSRFKIIGIITDEDAQIVLVDTPGILQKSKYTLHDYMLKEAKTAMAEADVVLLVVEPKPPGDIEEAILEEFRRSKEKRPVILVINKIDTVHKNALLPIMQTYSEMYDFAEIVPVSALKGDGLDILLDVIKKHLPEGTPFYPGDEITDKPLRFIIAEIIRERIFVHYREEIPYSTAVKVEEFRESDDPNKPVYIRATIYVERPSQKAIIIGRRGRAIKRVGIEARKQIEAILGRKVYLDLWVKVKKKWRENLRFIRELELGL